MLHPLVQRGRKLLIKLYLLNAKFPLRMLVPTVPDHGYMTLQKVLFKRLIPFLKCLLKQIYVYLARLERQGRNKYINLASQIAYNGNNLAFVFFENQIRKLMVESPLEERRLEVLRASCVGQPREMVNLFFAPFNRFKAGLFGHRRKLGGGRAYPRSLNACIFVNTRAKVSKKITISQGFYKLFAKI